MLGLIGGAVASGIASGIGKQTGSFIGGLFKRKKDTAKEAKDLAGWQSMLEEDRMNLQAKLNREQAKYNNDLAKSMFDYTMKQEAEYNDPKKQIERLKNAGLNPALIYGQNAAGASGTAQGSTSGAGEAGAVTALQPMGLQVALQMRGQEAQIELAESQAAANWAQAGKTAGIDTKQGQKNLEESDSRILLNKAQAAKTGEDINLILEQIKEKKISNEVSEETKTAKIDSELESLNILKQQAAMNVTEQLKNETELKIIEKDLKNYDDKLQAIFDDVATRKLTADAAWGQYEATKAWLEKQYGNKDAEKLQTYTNVGATILSTLIDVASFIPQAKMLKLLKLIK